MRFDGSPIAGAGQRRLAAPAGPHAARLSGNAGALDRRMPIGAQIAEPLAVHGLGGREEHRARTAELRAVGLRPDQAASYPHELSGGQRQRAPVLPRGRSPPAPDLPGP